jgi:hypothetical protein
MLWMATKPPVMLLDAMVRNKRVDDDDGGRGHEMKLD